MFHRIFKNAIECFKGNNLAWQGAMIGLTAILVLSGFDWTYFVATRGLAAREGFLAAGIGFLVPVIVPVTLYALSTGLRHARLGYAASGSAQAGILALAISSLYKVFTGRVGLPHTIATIDTSHIFRFGIYRGGAFQGWPSSHTAVAFAMSFALITIFPKNRVVRIVAVLYAIFIAFGVSTTIHWLSDVLAGAILGIVIGITVGREFARQMKTQS